MCKNCLSCIVRYAQILNMAFGAALCTYGIVFAAKTQGFGIAVGGSLGVGLLEILLATLVFCCVKWLFCLRLNVMIGGLLTLAEFVLAILFLIPSTRVRCGERARANNRRADGPCLVQSAGGGRACCLACMVVAIADANGCLAALGPLPAHWQRLTRAAACLPPS
jgi:hypothetical protein